MRRLLEHLGAIDRDGATMAACAECGHVLGPLSAGYKTLAARFDEPITASEPAGLVSDGDAFLLRHYCCPQCATLFEVDMVERSAPEVVSLRIEESVV
jgi:acetone carboxylase gamma subunit